jgi:electron transfer flavoprotein beta subunit
MRPYLNLTEWSVADVKADVKACGLSGSPTKVKKIENVVFQAKESKTLSPSDTEIEELMIELIANHTIG